MRETKPLLRTNLSTKEIVGLILDINIRAIEEIQTEKGETLSDYKDILISMGKTLDEFLKVGEKWKQKFIGYKDRLKEDNIYDTLSQIFHQNIGWFSTLRSTLYIMEEDLLITSQPSVNELWNLFFEIEDRYQGNYIRKFKIKENYERLIKELGNENP